ncbi:MAG: cytochrome B [Saprospiraceae bacterium]|nr:cytochrome B [Saprospiraceae bacterium]
MYEILKHAHSGLRWLVLAFLVWAIINAFSKRRSGADYTAKDKRPALFGLITTHLQLVLGLILYFISPLVSFEEGFMKNTITRFYTIEHLSLMLLAIILITVGYSRAKRKSEDKAKFGSIFTFYLIGLILILLAIPWPFRGLGGGWG